ncbi:MULTISPECIES: integration host factor subunit beta [Candidatus Nitrosacidococcus]|uniref:Integration host factor subunit beta n=1 Tax=Candidatus Nitrosacidococcus tergens TaxID=553981 RepID=A0A7G1QA85_9GAMM|nr:MULTISPECIES: integration host factor subunit beta [Candidatus Nitrosacidococcus]CAB1275877.1 integration host factor (IHF), DNA-binding protein, beta subunit [Candidatus Nitrosacidococcus tergens]CAH9018404.1 Integration host factor subunit beta [Candidatus Nitrosacidococcus sp. I8]
MTKSNLIDQLTQQQKILSHKDVDDAVRVLLELMSKSLSDNQRIEIRGFGSFSLHYRPPRTGRNPKTGELVSLPPKYIPHFKAGKELRKRVDNL